MGLLAYYRVHGGVLLVMYADGRVVSVETDSAFYRTASGIGPGTSKAGLGGFHQDFCSGGLWDGSGDLPLDEVVTVFQRSGDEVANVTITELGYYDLCEVEGTSQGVQDPRPKSSHLEVKISPDGGGYVQSSGLEISCPVECSKTFDTDTTLTLTAHPTGGFAFLGWSGACTGAGACAVTLDGPTTVTAHFVGAYQPGTPPGKATVGTTTVTVPTTTTTTTTTTASTTARTTTVCRSGDPRCK